MPDSLYTVNRGADLGMREIDAYPRILRLELVGQLCAITLAVGKRASSAVVSTQDDHGRTHRLVCHFDLFRAKALIPSLNTLACVRGEIEIAGPGETVHTVTNPAVTPMRHHARHAAGQRRMG